MDYDDDQGLPDAAFTEDELAAGIQHLARGDSPLGQESSCSDGSTYFLTFQAAASWSKRNAGKPFSRTPNGKAYVPTAFKKNLTAWPRNSTPELKPLREAGLGGFKKLPSRHFVSDVLEHWFCSYDNEPNWTAFDQELNSFKDKELAILIHQIKYKYNSFAISCNTAMSLRKDTSNTGHTCSVFVKSLDVIGRRLKVDLTESIKHPCSGFVKHGQGWDIFKD